MNLLSSSIARTSALLALILAGQHVFAQTNVAFGAPVSVYATDSYGGYNNGTAANLQKITNGTVLPDPTTYASSAAIAQAVEWNGTGYVFQITLPTVEDLTGIIVDADDNDEYILTYFDSTTNSWNSLYDATIVSDGFGIRTRPNDSDPTVEASLPNIVTSEVRIQGGASDDHFCGATPICNEGGYALAQVELFGTPAVTSTSVTPEPSSIALFATGLAGAAGFIRRRVRS